MSKRIFLILCLTVTCLAAVLPGVAGASPPSPFSAQYKASYGSFKADGERSLSNTGPDQYEMTTSLKLKFLGQTLSSITETSRLSLDGNSEQFMPVEYDYNQRGIGKRKRHIDFDWNAGVASAVSGKETKEITLEGPVFDNLSSYLEIYNQLTEGKQDIYFQVIDKNELKDYHFRVLGSEEIDTALGKLQTLKLERVRAPDSDRSTEIWLAMDWDYLLVRLIQEEPGSRTIRLEIKNALMDGREVTGVDG